MEGSKSMSEENQDTLQNILTEPEVLKITVFKKTQLAEARNKRRLPFTKISRNCRLYLERDIAERFGLSRAGLCHHKRKCLPEALAFTLEDGQYRGAGIS
jgi:hypothetical protein